MADVIRQVGTERPILRQEVAGPLLVVYSGGAPPQNELPTGGVTGEVLAVDQAAPKGVVWTNAIDGGTFN